MLQAPVFGITTLSGTSSEPSKVSAEFLVITMAGESWYLRLSQNHHLAVDDLSNEVDAQDD
jgi:hypothetical protein